MQITGNPSSRSLRSWDQNELKLLSLWKYAKEDSSQFSDENLSDEDLLDLVKSEIRKNHKFTLFCVIPFITTELMALKRTSAKLGISEDLARYFSSRLLRSGLWTVEDGRVVTKFQFLDLGDISVKEYLSMTVSIIAQLSDDKPGTYETVSLATTRPLARTFIGKVNQALRELTEKSEKEAARNVLFSWTHTGVINLEVKNEKKEEDYI
ncbi:hypothetical protein AZI86_17635 [Bdellovibrio bacteriovorus]|uniref:Uncharacterized protein n=1 Tax=Bdellovibrio bacteriovorus TaxID=959 RepID=A0A150WES5_BDEBC|nr:hypothetical protein [Bdellovibrio bacteriovorus]KYG61529.1 hypothetical protein AZI86_17635 [Bdellovibrio bacteriovorus]